MQKQIKITSELIGAETVNSVNARELYEHLDIKKPFSDWIKTQITSLSLDENIDYITFKQKLKRETGASTRKEYTITTDTAKHIAMASRTAKGKDVRKYFIAIEKKYIQELENNTYVYQLERENTELRRAINRISLESPSSEVKKLQFENKHLKRTLIQLHDNYHNIVIKSQQIEVVKKELWQMTNQFQLISNVECSGNNLNTETVAGHSYW